MLELYHWEPNTHFLKPLIALHEKQVPFLSRWFDPASFEQYTAAFPRDTQSRLHLETEGPVLVHDGRVISNSSFMLEYIAASFLGTDLTPGDAFQHYRIHAWGQVMTGIGADICILGCAKYLAPRLQERAGAALQAQLARVEPLERRLAWSSVIDGTYDDRALAASWARLEISLQRLERQLVQSTWLAGPDYSIADIDAFSLLAPLPGLMPELVAEKSAPRIADFLRRMHARKAVQEALALSRSGRPFEAFAPGAEPSRWG
jgi:GSH-dependent disulfide-bond oxidoreductase